MNIAIAGYGVEGKSSYRYYASRGNTVTILDERESVDDLPPEAKSVLGVDAFKNLVDFDMVVRTPSLLPKKLSAAKKIWSATNEFFAECPAPIIGVTGTKGKGTTCSLITSILRSAGKTVHLVGNIGAPSLEVLPSIKPDDIVVYELSSFQLWDVERSPQVAVVLMIEPDHLDIHASFEEYIAAKANIRKYQQEKDICFYHPSNEYSREIAEVNPLPNAHRYNNRSDSFSVYVEEGYFCLGSHRICQTSALQLPGQHNIENATAAISVVMEFIDDDGVIEKGLRAFTGLDHRLKFIRSKDDVSFYDDSIATTIGSAVAAIAAFSQPKILILGGSSKGVVNFDELARAASMSSVKCIIAIGDLADTIESNFRGTGVPVENLGSNVTMDQIVAKAQQLSVAGDVVILSPACASFGMFKNYADRGNQFIAAVNAL